MNDLGTQIRNGDRRALAKAVTLLESTLDTDAPMANDLLRAISGKKGRSIRVGVCGSPGVGKSSFIDVLGMEIIKSAHKVAVLAVDPTSPISGGSILGDKTRMEKLSLSDSAFIRPSPGGGVPGGVTANTHEVILLLEYAGFDYIILETIGIGQSETDVANLVDTLIYLHQPESGDDLQAIKKGILEVSDYFVVTKADGNLQNSAEYAAQHLRSALSDPHDSSERVFCVSSTEKIGFEKIQAVLSEKMSDQTSIARKRELQKKQLFESRLTNDFKALLTANSRFRDRIESLGKRIKSGKSLREESGEFFSEFLK